MGKAYPLVHTQSNAKDLILTFYINDYTLGHGGRPYRILTNTTKKFVISSSPSHGTKEQCYNGGCGLGGLYDHVFHHIIIVLPCTYK